jgi:hypothetical protein
MRITPMDGGGETVGDNDRVPCEMRGDTFREERGFRRRSVVIWWDISLRMTRIELLGKVKGWQVSCTGKEWFLSRTGVYRLSYSSWNGTHLKPSCSFYK